MTNMTRSALLFTPIPLAQAHTTEEFVQTLARLDIASRQLSPDPAIDSADTSLLSRTRSHIRTVRSLPDDSTFMLVLWPAFGWLEPMLWGGARNDARLIVHDPVPIRRQYGQGRLARAWARKAVRQMDTRFICHTEEAAKTTALQLDLRHLPSVCLHPILTMPDTPPMGRSKGGADPVVLVAGQYKPSRDVELLSELGPRLKSSGLRPRIVGRGWPAIAGWEVQDRFLSEREFEDEVSSAAVIVIPYRKYWQSGVAIQALEREIPVVGAPTSFLRTLFGDDYPGLTTGQGDPEAWLEAISTVANEPPDMYSSRRRYQDEVDRSWAPQFTELGR
jgi:glycosyltransferase involved in cell wall biosynthesis